MCRCLMINETKAHSNLLNSIILLLAVMTSSASISKKRKEIDSWLMSLPPSFEFAKNPMIVLAPPQTLQSTSFRNAGNRLITGTLSEAKSLIHCLKFQFVDPTPREKDSD